MSRPSRPGTHQPSARRTATRCPRGRRRAPVRERELGGTELEVVAPGRLRIEGVRQRGDDIGSGGRRKSSLRRRPKRPARARAERASAAYARRPAPRAHTRRRPGRRDSAAPSSQACSRGTRAAPGGNGCSLREPVVALGQAPEIVVAIERALLVARADADLDVHHLAPLVPRLPEPVEPEAGLRAERGRCVRAQRTSCCEEQCVRVRRRVRELDEVARVDPAAGEVDPVFLGAERANGRG